jgi:hypothetical protein
MCSARISTRVAPPTGVNSHVIVMVPAYAGSSETKSTACTTRSPGTMSTNRASTMSDFALALPRPTEASALREDQPIRAAGTRLEMIEPARHSRWRQPCCQGVGVGERSEDLLT